MPDPIVRYSREQFALLLAAYDPDGQGRRIDSVHLHHTWRPNHSQFRGQASVEAMRRFHMETNGWSDIAQHLTLDPAGGLWSGRRWTRPPASSGGANGTAAKGPFMIEMVGDFDHGKDVLEGEQRASMLEVVARLVIRFGLDANDPGLATAVRFHRELNQGRKTCPGSAVDLAEIRREVAAKVAELRPEAAADPAAPRSPRGRKAVSPPASPAIDARLLAGYDSLKVDDAGSRAAVRAQDEGAEVPENPRALERQLEVAAGLARAEALGSRGASFGSKYTVLEPHVINLSDGELSSKGNFTTEPIGDLEEIFDFYLPAWCRQVVARGGTPRLMIHAHGGLVSENKALDYALVVHRWWLANDVYPLYFVWETQLHELIAQWALGPRALGGRRDVFDHTTDPLFEATVSIPGTAAWNRIKASAERASSPDLGEGVPGGAYQTARRLARFLDDWRKTGGPEVEVHAVGHSAGSIFHAHFLPLLVSDPGRPVSVRTLSLLAPALRIDVFKDRLQPLIGATSGVGRVELFTMTRQTERADSVTFLYQKSLLYLVARAFEPDDPAAILGLAESFEPDPDLKKLFATDQANAHFSPTPASAPGPITRAIRHGDFDNDPATMESVMKRVLGMPDSLKPRVPFPTELQRLLVGGKPAHGERLLVGGKPAHGERPLVGGKPAHGSNAVAGGGARRALCVGIDEYPAFPLAGCVADSRDWGAALEREGFDVTFLHNEQATLDRIVSELDALVASGHPGDVLVFQFAGHGTQFKDEDKEEGEPDFLDEAFVPVDFQTGAYLLDDDLALIADRLRDGVNFTMFMDCCHSGTNQRAAPLASFSSADGSERIRILPRSERREQEHRAFRAKNPGLRRARSAAPLSESRAIHFAACRDHEFAFEMDGHGEFTVRAAPLLARAVAEGWTSQELQDQVVAAFGPGSRQNPLFTPDHFLKHPVLAPLATSEGSSPAAPPRPAAEAAATQAGPPLSEVLARVERLGKEIDGLRKVLRQRLEADTR